MLHNRPPDIHEELLALTHVWEGGVLVLEDERHGIVCAHRRTVCQLHWTCRLEQVGQSEWIQRDNAVDALPGGLAPHRRPDLGGVREVRTDVRVGPDAQRSPVAVLIHVLRREPRLQRRHGHRRKFSVAGNPRQLHPSLVGLEDHERAQQTAGAPRLGVVLHGDEVPPGS